MEQSALVHWRASSSCVHLGTQSHSFLFALILCFVCHRLKTTEYIYKYVDIRTQIHTTKIMLSKCIVGCVSMFHGIHTVANCSLIHFPEHNPIITRHSWHILVIHHLGGEAWGTWNSVSKKKAPKHVPIIKQCKFDFIDYKKIRAYMWTCPLPVWLLSCL